MSLASSTSRNDYTGNGAVDTYSYTFKILDESHLKVTVRNTLGVETVLTLSTHYTVTGVGEPSGGTVALVNGAFAWLDAGGDLLTDYALTIRRVVPVTQLTDIRNQGSFYPEVHEDVFDYLTMVTQQVADEASRAAKSPETVSSAVFDPTLPSALSENPGASLIINDDGDGFDIGPTADEVAAAEAYATTASEAAVAATEALDAIGDSEANAAASAAAAETSANNAASAEAGAGASETQADTYASNAATSATAASGSATTATTQATNAATSATAAATSATNAATSATAAATSATTASTQATNASTSATNAANSATAAATSATNAAASALLADGSFSYEAKSSAFTAAFATGGLGKIYYLSGASFDITLPNPASNTGKTIRFLHGGTSLTEKYTFIGGYTINGIASGSYKLCTNTESVALMSNGSNYLIVQRSAETAPASYAGGVTGFGTVTSAFYSWYRQGKRIIIDSYWTNGTVAASLASIALPGAGAITIDTTHLPRGNTTAASGQLIGGQWGSANTALSGRHITATGTSTSLIYFVEEFASSTLIPANGSSMAGNSQPMASHFEVTIAEFQP